MVPFALPGSRFFLLLIPILISVFVHFNEHQPLNLHFCCYLLKTNSQKLDMKRSSTNIKKLSLPSSQFNFLLMFAFIRSFLY